MRHSVLAVAVFGAVSAIAGLAHAGEGMWVPQQLPEIAGPLKKAGLKLNPKQLANLTGDPMAAVVSLGLRRHRPHPVDVHLASEAPEAEPVARAC